jgi:hypothetical protein
VPGVGDDCGGECGGACGGCVEGVRAVALPAGVVALEV